MPRRQPADVTRVNWKLIKETALQVARTELDLASAKSLVRQAETAYQQAMTDWNRITKNTVVHRESRSQVDTGLTRHPPFIIDYLRKAGETKSVDDIIAATLHHHKGKPGGVRQALTVMSKRKQIKRVKRGWYKANGAYNHGLI